MEDDGGKYGRNLSPRLNSKLTLHQKVARKMCEAEREEKKREEY